VSLKISRYQELTGAAWNSQQLAQTAPHLVVPVLVQELPVIQLLDKPDTAMLSNCTTFCGLTEWLIPGALRGQLHFTVLNKSPFSDHG